jgi:hypothetical protein
VLLPVGFPNPTGTRPVLGPVLPPKGGSTARSTAGGKKPHGYATHLLPVGFALAAGTGPVVGPVLPPKGGSTARTTALVPLEVLDATGMASRGVSQLDRH